MTKTVLSVHKILNYGEEPLKYWGILVLIAMQLEDGNKTERNGANVIEYINNLQEIGAWNILIIIVLVLLIIDGGLKLIDSLCKRFGITTKWSKRELEQRRKLDEHEEAIRSLTTSVSKIDQSVQDIADKLEQEQEKSDKRERNKLRDKLLQNYRYYTNREKNPALSWSEMESDAFWQMFKDYEDLHGDGYLHSEVQNAMNRLNVISMSDTEELLRMMSGRK